MGITLESKNFSINMGYAGFFNLRAKVAELTGKAIGQHYNTLRNVMFEPEEEKERLLDIHYRKTDDLANSLKIPQGVIDFIYASYDGGKLIPSRCKQIYKVIENYDDNVCYGYCCTEDCAMFKDFKQIIKDCIDNTYSMEWSCQ